MTEPIGALDELARSMGVATRYRDGLGHDVVVSPETLLCVCASLGAPVERIGDAESALHLRVNEEADRLVDPVVVAWNGVLDVAVNSSAVGAIRGTLRLEDGTTATAETATGPLRFAEPVPMGHHRLRIEVGFRSAECAVIAAPERSWHPPDARPRWGVAAQLAALRSARSRSVGDLVDMATFCEWVGVQGGDLVSLLPLLPTFNDAPSEPSPYSPVSRLFWSELILDLGAGHEPVTVEGALRTGRADAEIRVALAHASPPGPGLVDDELARYARFRAAQRELGRDWRRWPERARRGPLHPSDLDPAEERLHLTAQVMLRRQLGDLAQRMESAGVHLGLDLAVGVHPLGYDVWSRPDLFALDMSVGAPPDAGFPSGQSWGFPPVRPDRSREEHHAYLAAGVAHQAALADVLRVDHIMAMHRLYWIPAGMDRAEGTYVHYPSEELFAVLCLESHRNQCELIGENLGTVPAEIDEALPRHRIGGMYVAEFAAAESDPPRAPEGDVVAMIDTHDTPTFAGWLAGLDIDERVRLALLKPEAAEGERQQRDTARRRMAHELGGEVDDPEHLLALLIEWLGGSDSPLVMIWLEDLWLEREPVNVPGSTSTQRPNWQRPMKRSLEQVMTDQSVAAHLTLLDTARRGRA